MTESATAIPQRLAADTSWPTACNKNSNKAAVLYGANDMRFEAAPELGKLQASHVRVEIKAVGICGTDVHFLRTVRS